MSEAAKTEKGRRLRGQDRQAVVDGFGESAVSGDGKEGAVAEGEVRNRF